MSDEARKPSLPVVVDCLDRFSACGARCCTFDVPLTDEEVASGRYRVAKHPPGAVPLQRTFLARGDNGLCVYHRAEPEACSIYEQRPARCRAFSCAGDPRLWKDFERRVFNHFVVDHLTQRGTVPPRSVKLPDEG